MGAPSGNKINVETNKLVNNLILNPGCTNPNNIHTTALIYSAANKTLLDELAPSNTAGIRLKNKIIMQPKVTRMKIRETLQTLFNKIPEPGCKDHRECSIISNLLSASILVDTGCEVFLYGTGAGTSYNGEIIIRGWRDIHTRIWLMPLLPDGNNNNIPPKNNVMDESSTPKIPNFLNDIIFECGNKYQLIKYYHATMGYPVIFTLCKAIYAEYFRGCPSITSKIVCRHIKVTA